MLVHSYYPGDVRVRRQAECLAGDGMEVHVICLRRPLNSGAYSEQASETVNGVHVHRINLSRKRGSKVRYLFEFAMITVWGFWKVTALHLTHRFDVVHIHNMPDFLVFSGLIAKWMGAHLVHDVHDPMPELYQENYHLNQNHKIIHALEFQERLSFRRVDHLITVSSPMAENVAAKAGIPVEKITIVHNYPDLSYFPIREDLRKWPYSRDKFVFLYSGTVTEHYRLDVAVRAFARAVEEVPGLRFQILGAGPKVPEILQLADELGIADIVELLEPVPVEEVSGIMGRADAGISTHQSGVFGDLYFSTKIIEFMTQGLPVVASRTYTIAKYVPEECIFYFTPQDVEDLARTIVRMCQNPGLVQERVKNSRELLSRYVWQEEGRHFLKFYQDLVKSKGQA